MIILFRVGTPKIFFSKMNTMVHGRLEPPTTVQNSTLLCFQNIDIFSIYRATKARSVL